MKEMKNAAVKEEETWADKLGISHKKLPFPEQPKATISGEGDPFAPGGQAVPNLETNRVQSAPEKETDDRCVGFFRYRHHSFRQGRRLKIFLVYI